MLAVLEHISICYSIHQELIAAHNIDPKDSTLAWLWLYKFEAKLFLGHSDLDAVLEKVSALASVEAKTLETMAALCLRAAPSGKHALPSAEHALCPQVSMHSALR